MTTAQLIIGIHFYFFYKNTENKDLKKNKELEKLIIETNFLPPTYSHATGYFNLPL
jgi:hypothetical protein